MTGQIEWALYGGMAVAGGIGLILVARRRGEGASPED